MIFFPKPKTILTTLAVVVIVSGVFLSIWLYYFFHNHNIILTPDNQTPDFTVTGPIGDFVGGVIGTVFTFATTLLVIVTLLEQRDHSHREHFAQNYYEMLRIHNDNVSRMQIRKPNGEVIRGREVFAQLKKDYERIFDYVHSYMLNIINGGVEDLQENEDIGRYLSTPDNLKSLEMRLAYGYYFFGSEDYHLQKAVNPIEHNIEKTIRNLMEETNTVVYSHHVLLGHYYRHIYQMIMQIVNEKSIDEEERYTYAKQLRAQLNDNEQLLLYYNAMSEVGDEWLKKPNSEIKIKKRCQMCPMARFRMIKNLQPNIMVKGIQPKDKFKAEIQIYKTENETFFEIE